MSQQLIEKILSDTASPSEQKEFEIWLNTSEENRKYFKKTKVIWESLNKSFLTKKFSEEAAQINIISKITERKSKLLRIKRFKYISYAASVLILIGLSYFAINRSIRSDKFTQIYSAENSIKQFELDDGSHVWLNKNSVLKISDNFGKKQRKTILEGEAYFEVKPDKTKPFKVFTGNTVTRVLGTSFNLWLDKKNNVTLNVNSGKVEFYKKYMLFNKQIYTSCDMGYFQKDIGKINKSENKGLNYIAWKTGVLNFENTPLHEVCKVLSKHYGKVITTSINQPDYLLSATYPHETLDNIIETICITFDIKTTIEGDTISLFQ